MPKGNGTILFVDDEDAILDLGRQMLAALGYNVLPAGGGEEALRVYEEHQEGDRSRDPGYDHAAHGRGETFDRMRKINPDVKVLLSSGYSLDGQAQEILDRGCDGFLQKPFDLKILWGKLGEILASGMKSALQFHSEPVQGV